MNTSLGSYPLRMHVRSVAAFVAAGVFPRRNSNDRAYTISMLSLHRMSPVFPSSQRILQLAQAILPQEANLEILQRRSGQILVRMRVCTTEDQRKQFAGAIAGETEFFPK
jgi:hypothetical protein